MYKLRYLSSKMGRGGGGGTADPASTVKDKTEGGKRRREDERAGGGALVGIHTGGGGHTSVRLLFAGGPARFERDDVGRRAGRPPQKKRERETSSSR